MSSKSSRSVRLKASKSRNKKKPVADGLKPSEMSRPQLLGFIKRMQDELLREREERNFYMLEREKMFQMWNLLMEQIALEKEKAALFDNHLKDVEKMKDNEEDTYERKLRFLKREHTRRLGQVRLQHLIKMKHVQDDSWAVMMTLREGLMAKRKEMRDLETQYYYLLRGFYWRHSKDISDLRSAFANEIRRLETHFDRRLFENADRKEDDHTKRLQILAELKESQVKEAVSSHFHQTRELTDFFRDLLRHNLHLIYGMKEAAQKEKQLELRAKSDYERFKRNYDNYVAQAFQWKKEMEEWTILHMDDDPPALTLELRDLSDELERKRMMKRMIDVANETLLQRLNMAEKEKECLKKKYAEGLLQGQRVMSMNKFVNQVKYGAAKREAELYDVLAGGEEGKELEATLLQERTAELEDLQEEALDYSTDYRDVEANYKVAFAKNEIHIADLGFPLKEIGIKPPPKSDQLLSGDAIKIHQFHHSHSHHHGSQTSEHNTRSSSRATVGMSSASAMSMSIMNTRSRQSRKYHNMKEHALKSLPSKNTAGDNSSSISGSIDAKGQ